MSLSQNHRVRASAIWIGVTAVGFGAFIGWAFLYPQSLPKEIGLLLLTILAGGTSIAMALIAYEWVSIRISRQELLGGPTMPDSDEREEMIPSDAPSAPKGYTGPRLPETTPISFQYVMWLLPVVPLWWFTSEIDDIIALVRTIPTISGFELQLAVFAFALVLAVVVHELSHGAVAALLGYSISFGGSVIPMPEVHITIDGGLLTRGEYLAILLAPLIILTVVFATTGLLATGWLVLAAFKIVIFNILLASKDVYDIFKILNQSPGTLYYHPAGDEPMVVYDHAEPEMSILNIADQWVEKVVGPTEGG